MGELESLIDGKHPRPVIFNGSLADQYRDHHFLPPCGFWTRFLLSELESIGKVFKCFSFLNNDKEIPLKPGSYVVPMFEVKLDGFRIELDLAAVPVRLADQQIPDCDFRKLSRLLGRDIVETELNPSFLELEPGYFIDLGRDALERQVEEKMDLLRVENKYRIEARISSLERGSEIRIERLKKKISEHRDRAIVEGKEPSHEFIRLTEAQIAIEGKSKEHKVKKLQARSELSLTLSLVGVVLLEVGQKYKGEIYCERIGPL
jgi:hypothetical protein